MYQKTTLGLLRKNAALDPDYATGFLQRELRNVLAARWPNVRVVERPADADLIFWMVWDFAFCAVFSPIEALAWEAGALRALTAEAGLSLGDRFCLALAKREGVPAYTADQAWKKVADAAKVKVTVIR